MWEADNGDWAFRAFMDLVEGGDIRRLFSDAELLELVGAEEEYERRVTESAHERGATPRGAAGATTGGRSVNTLDEAPDSDGSSEAGPGISISSKNEVGRKPVRLGVRVYRCVPAQNFVSRTALHANPEKRFLSM